MRRFLLSLLIVALSAGIAAAQDLPQIPGINAAPPGPQPKAQILNPLYDFGTALEGKMVDHVFKIKNVGKGELMIRGVKTSCGCTAASPTKNHLAPGEETDISVGFDTHFQKGHQVRTITAFTNDPQMPQAVMTIQGVVKQQVAATPDKVAFGTVRKGTPVSQEVTIHDLTNLKDFKVATITNSSPSIKVTREPSKSWTSDVVLKVELLPTMQPGAFDDSIKVITNRVPLQIDVFGTVTGDLTLDPPQVSFGIVPKGQDVVRILKLTNSGPKDVKVLGITSSVTSVAAAAEAVKPGKEFRITATLGRSTPEGQLRGQLTIKTDDPDQATINVPFYAIVGQFKM